jgi:UDP-N-acetylmuramoyl-tripeptide--D-alanyl-D-alanine ligase
MIEELKLPEELKGSLLFTGYAVDSRMVQGNNLFFALEGERVDGHDYLSDASKRGARVGVVNERYEGEDYGLDLIRVDDPLLTLQALAHGRLEAMNARVVGITGSVGKTTTKNFLEVIASSRYRVMATPGNQNSQIGLPLAILNHLNGDEEVVILEMGMSESGNISRLVDIAPPDISLVTRIDLVHAGNFDSIEQIAMSKGEIFKHPHTGIGVLPSGCEGFDTLLKSGSCYKKEFSLDSEEGKRLLEDPRVPFSQKHICYNLLAALTVANCLGIKYEDAAAVFHQLRLPEKRLTTIIKNGVTFIDDSYNACEVSVKAAIDSMPKPELPDSRKVAVFGEMRELGKFSQSCHEEVAKYAIDRVDVMFCLGERCQPMVSCWKEAQRPVEFYVDREQLARDLKTYLQPGDVVLVKGSHAMEMGEIIDQV